jgi:proteasome lid subunit RPN8/RPN11
MDLHHNPINKTNTQDLLDFPVYVYTKDVILPDIGNYYVIARDGIWLRKDTGICYGFVKVDGIGGLSAFSPSVGLRLPKLPAAIIFQALLFFRRIYQKHRSEALLFLIYSPSKKTFGFFCPTQKVSHTRISYDHSDVALHGDLVVAGTFHSHCGFGAFHSYVDQHDEENFDGLHVTLGHVDEAAFSIVGSIVVNKTRFPIDPCDKICGLQIYSNLDKRYKLLLENKELIALNRRFKDYIDKWETKITTFDSYFAPKYKTVQYAREILPPVQNSNLVQKDPVQNDDNLKVL